MAAPAPAPKLAAVLGWPIGHSLSPLIHRTWAEREGAAAYYAPIAVKPDFEEFCRAADALAALGFSGCNVTLPHKENALRYAKSASPAAAAAGAANMLTFAGEGAHADNSDIEGFAAALREAGPFNGGRAVVLGAGGAARAVVLALGLMGAAPIVIVNRTPEKASAVAALVKGAIVAPWTERAAALEGAGVLVNTTSLGMTGAGPLDLDLARLPAAAAVADIVYSPLETALLAAARASGRRTADGLAMLMHQAVFAYKAWLGREAVVDADLRRRLEAELARRAGAGRGAGP